MGTVQKTSRARNPRVAALLLCFEVGPDGVPRIRDDLLAKRVGAPRATVRAMIERDLLGDDALGGVVVVERGDRHREYHLTQLGALYVAGRVGTRQGNEVLLEMISTVSSLPTSALRELGGDDSPLVRIRRLFEGGE
jgi:hypothetical protein